MKVIEVFGMRKNRNSDSKLVGWCNVVIDCDSAELVVNGCAVIDGKNGKYVAMPSRKIENRDGKTEYRDVCYIRNGREYTDAFSDETLALLAVAKAEKKVEDDDLPF